MQCQLHAAAEIAEQNRPAHSEGKEFALNLACSRLAVVDELTVTMCGYQYSQNRLPFVLNIHIAHLAFFQKKSFDTRTNNDWLGTLIDEC